MTAGPPAWHEVPANVKTTLTFPVAIRADGSAIALPVLVVRGKQPGKTLLVTAGVHGDEFEGMATLRQIHETLEPGRLVGTLIAVPVANPPAFEAGLRTNPDDRQDMARVFPGDPAGTVTEQLAHALTHRFIRHAELYCDLHSAGQYYAMPALVGYQLRPEPLLTVQRQAARAFGLPLIWGTPGLPGRSLSAAAELGVPALYAEITGEGRCRPADVERYVHGVRQLLAYLGMTGTPPATHEPTWFVEDARPQAGFLQVQNRAPMGGFFDAEVPLWGRVESGQRLGTIRDSLGVVRHIIRATHSGRIVFLRTFPRILAGDPICTVLEMAE
ncbi:MAG: succinylglutamate desuccinylase/aspartoacylase family protein [Gemmataceae bacterium]|nr:succinylglutamate desuccinylase/aspartoacylase family protein [Gemmataceae bacterium]